MKKILLTLIAAVFMSSTTFAQQSATDGVKQAINTLFDAMRKGDSALIKTVFAKEMVLQSISNDKTGKAVIAVDSGEDFAKAIGTPHNVMYDERITFNDIKIDGDLASVWAPYKFYLGDKFSHCGVDVFSLMKTATGWKIIYIVDTRRKDNCIE
ncbi:MAG: nuclear transport factor 2 family protein [Bacteroidota bacterium]